MTSVQQPLDNYGHYGKDGLIDKSRLEHTGYFDSDGVYYKVTYDHGGDGKARRGFQGGISPLGKYPNDTCFCQTWTGLEAGHVCHLRFLDDRVVSEWCYDEGVAEEEYQNVALHLGQITYGGLISVCAAIKDNARMLWFSRHLSEIMPMFERKTNADEITLFEGQAFTKRRGQKALVGEWLYSRQQQFAAVQKWAKVAVQYVKPLQNLKGKNKVVKGERVLTGLQAELAAIPRNVDGEPKYFEMVKFLEKTEKKVRKVQQEGLKIDNKKVPVLDLRSTLKKTKKDLLSAQAIVANQKAKATAQGPEIEAAFVRAIYGISPAVQNMLSKVDVVLLKIDAAARELETFSLHDDMQLAMHQCIMVMTPVSRAPPAGYHARDIGRFRRL